MLWLKSMSLTVPLVRRRMIRPLKDWCSGLLQPVNRMLLAAIGAANLFDPLAKLIARQVEELDQRGRPGPVRRRQGQLSILALSPGEFRHDLEALAARGVRVLRMPLQWQERLLYSFQRRGIGTAEIHNPPDGTRAARAKSGYQRFLEAFLLHLYRELDVDAVISANVKYKEDVDWGIVSEKLGVPYVIFHRENLAITEGVVNVVTDRYRKLGKFAGNLYRCPQRFDDKNSHQNRLRRP